MPLHCGRFELSLDRPLVMGVVNTTPDSFSDGGRFLDPSAAIAHGLRLVVEGADILDIGGESTRPGSAEVPVAQEIGRIVPVLEGLAGVGRPLSVDTRKPEVMRAALAAGADMINDINGFQAPGAVQAVAGSRAGLCVMHMQGQPLDMQQAPFYREVVADIRQFLDNRVASLVAAGVARERIVLDPGIGFGKTVEHNIELLRRLRELAVDGLPVLVGVSRKSLVGALTGAPVTERLAGSLAGALAAVWRGAAIVRVHDVKATCDALAVWGALSKE